jgi:hypothetical protein
MGITMDHHRLICFARTAFSNTVLSYSSVLSSSQNPDFKHVVNSKDVGAANAFDSVTNEGFVCFGTFVIHWLNLIIGN